MDWTIIPNLWPLPAVGIIFGIFLLFGSNLFKQYLDDEIMKYIRPAGTILVVLCVAVIILFASMWAVQSVRALADSVRPAETSITDEPDYAQPTTIPTNTPAATETPLPVTPTPEPTLPANALDPNCMPSGVFAGDVTVPDGTEFQPGESFTKTWLIRSDGCSAWPENSRLAFESGDQMGAEPSVSVPVTAPENTAEVSVQFTAPSVPGDYTSWWQLESEGGVRYGNRIYVQITVAGAQP